MSTPMQTVVCTCMFESFLMFVVEQAVNSVVSLHDSISCTPVPLC